MMLSTEVLFTLSWLSMKFGQWCWRTKVAKDLASTGQVQELQSRGQADCFRELHDRVQLAFSPHRYSNMEQSAL